MHCTENLIFFFRTPWKDVLSKKIALEHDLFCITGEDDISFSWKYDLFPWTENEIFLEKYMEIWYFLQKFQKDGLLKKIALEYDPSCIIWKNGFFSQKKHDIFSLDGKLKMIFLKKYMEIWYFLYLRGGVTDAVLRLPLPPKKNQRRSSNGDWLIDTLDWHSRKSSNNSPCFYGAFMGVFMNCFPDKKPRKLDI